MPIMPTHRKTVLVLVLLAFLFCFPCSIFAQDAGSSVQSEDDTLSIKLALVGPGDELYFWWGHLGLIIEDHATGEANFYDWGTFSFSNENFFVNFAFGRLLYGTTVTPASWVISEYTKANRDLVLYTLNLSPEQKRAIALFAANNVLPENRDYYYHHFFDNCSTRIRDVLDMALDGQFKAAFGEAEGRFTLRAHVRRHTWFSPFFDWILNFWMGQEIDRPIPIWIEMFLPAELAMRAGEFQYIDAEGNNVPLVSSIDVINEAKGRPIVLQAPRLQWIRELATSLAFSAILVFLCVFFVRRKGNHRAVCIFFGLVQSALGLFFGIAGTALFFFSFFTDHSYTYNNMNLFFVNPLFFAAVPLGLILAFSGNVRKRGIALRVSSIFWAYVFFGGILTMVLRIFPPFFHQNQVDVALVLPIALGMFYIIRQIRRSQVLT